MADDPRDRLYAEGVRSTHDRLSATDPQDAALDARDLGQMLERGVRSGFEPSAATIQATEALLRRLLEVRTRVIRDHARAIAGQEPVPSTGLDQTLGDATKCIESGLMAAYESLLARNPIP